MQLILLVKVSEPILKKLSLIEGYDKGLTYFLQAIQNLSFN